MRDFLGALVPIAPFVMIIAVVWFAMREKMARSRLRTDLQKEVVAKFSSGQELAEFLNSESGKWFMEDKSVSKWTGKGRIITLVVAGLVCVGAGIGFFFGGKDREATALFIGVGLALIASGAVSNWLSKKMGLAGQPPDQSGTVSRI